MKKFKPANFGEWLKHERRSEGLTQCELAKRARCAEITIRKIETHQRRPSKKLTLVLLETLGVDESDYIPLLTLARRTLNKPQVS